MQLLLDSVLKPSIEDIHGLLSSSLKRLSQPFLLQSKEIKLEYVVRVGFYTPKKWSRPKTKHMFQQVGNVILPWSRGLSYTRLMHRTPSLSTSLPIAALFSKACVFSKFMKSSWLMIYPFTTKVYNHSMLVGFYGATLDGIFGKALRVAIQALYVTSFLI